MTQDQAKKLKTLISDLVQAEINNSWIGSSDPYDRPVIEAELEVAQLKLDVYIKSLVGV